MSAARIAHRALTADGALAAIVGDRIFTHVPARSRKPYLVIGETVARPWDTASDRGRLEDVAIDVWIRGSRRADAEAATARIEAVLSFDAVAPLAPGLVNVVRGETRTVRLPERDLVRATIRFRFTSEDPS